MLKKKLLLFWAGALILVLSDCHCYRRQIPIKNAFLDIPDDLSGFSKKLVEEKFSLLMEQMISKSPYFYMDPKHPAALVLRFTLLVPKGAEIHSLLMVASLSSADPKNGDKKSFVSIPIEEGSILGQNVSRAMSTVLENLYRLQQGNLASNEIYRAKLEASLAGDSIDQSELINAIAFLGESRDQKALRPLIKLLSTTKDIALGNACLIALSELGALEAMPAIIEFAERKPAIIRRQAIIAAKRIASKLAAEWLLVMAYGHEDPIVRKEALTALEEVEKKLTKQGK